MAWTDILMIAGAALALTALWIATIDEPKIKSGDLALREAARTSSGIYSVSYAARAYRSSPGYRPATETTPVVLICHPIKKDDPLVASAFLPENPPRLLLESGRR